MDTLQIFKNQISIPKLENNRFLLFLFLPVLFMRFNAGLDLLCALFILFILFRLNQKQLFQAFIFLHLFEESIYIGSTASISILLFCPVIAFRLFMILLQKKVQIQKKHVLIFSFFLFSLLVSLLSGTFGKASVVVFMNVCIILLFSIVLKQEFTALEIFETMLETILISTSLVIVYGLVRFRFYNEARDGIRIPRFMGTYEPNYIAIYMNLGILSALYFRQKLGRGLSDFLFVIHLLALLMTQSTTGLAACLIALFLLFFQNCLKALQRFYNALAQESPKERKRRTALYGALFLFLVLFLFGGLYAAGMMQKVLGVVQKILSGNFDSATSGRIPIMKSFARNFIRKGAFNMLFGNGPQSFRLYTGYFRKFMYSHNTYVDLFYSFGLIGGSIVLVYALVTLFQGKFFFQACSEEQKKTLFLMRLVLLIFAFGLAIHCEDLTLWMFLL